jgi:hypothetical protein
MAKPTRPWLRSAGVSSVTLPAVAVFSTRVVRVVFIAVLRRTLVVAEATGRGSYAIISDG